jgi:outer membrane biosynthesis protein TonB
MAQILVLLKYTVTWRMEVAMSILKHQKLITLFGLSLLMSLSSPAQAQWPTLDLTAIKEGISSKIELVKQSKIVTEATKLGGKMNSAIGDAKSSVTKFAGDNLEKAKKKAEKLQKEKERLEEKKKKLEEKKEKLEKQKKKIEKAKKAMEEAKKLKEDAEKKIQEGKDMVNDVKSQVDEAKQMAADAQAAVNDAKATAQGAIADAKSTVGEVKSTVNDAKSTVGDAVGTVREEKNELQSAIGGQSGSAAADSSFVDDYVAQYEAGINSDAKIYEQMPAADSEAVSETLPAAGDVAAEPADEAETALAPAAGDMSAVVAPEDMSAQQPVAAVAGAAQTVTGGKQLNRRPFGRKDMTAGTAAVQSSAVSTVTGTLQTAPAAVSSAATGQAATPATSAATPSAAVETAPAAVKTQAVGRSIRTRASAAPSAVSAAAAGQAATPATSAATPSAAVETAPAAVKTQAVGRSIRTRASAAPSAVSAAATGQAATSATSAATPSAAVEAAPAAVKTQPARRSFRQRATIKKDNQASLFELKQSVNLAAGSYSETLMFGAEDSGESIPDGVIHNGEYEETIIPDTIVDYCNIGVDQLQDTSVMQNCLKQLITHQSDSDNQVAEEGKALFTKATAEIAIATVAESMQQKVIAAKYQEQVQDKREETLASASTSRDDSGGLAMTNSGEQTLLNALSAMAAAQLSIDAFNQVGGFTKEDLGETEGEDE